MTMIIGPMLFPSPREAAMVQSIKAEMLYANAMILIRSMPASITARSVANARRKYLPPKNRHAPRKSPIRKE